MLASLLNDVRYALRGFALRPAFAVVVVATLAVAIGANVTVFSLYDQLMLRELPVSRPGELVNFAAAGPKGGITMCGSQGSCDETFSYPLFRDLEKADGPFASMAASKMIGTNIAVGDHTAFKSALLVSGRYFATLGIGPELGRMLDSRDDAVPGEASVAVLSYDYWRNSLGADAAVLGKTIVVNGRPLEIVGVAPRGFVGTTIGERPQVFVPISFPWLTLSGMPSLYENRFAEWVYVFARLKPGVGVAEAQAAINVPYHAFINDFDASTAMIRRDQVDAYRAKTLELKPGSQGQSSTPSQTKTPLAVLFAATATILLIACANLANLMFARGAARIGEMAVRTSLGAGRQRLVSLLGVEALVLAGGAALASLPVAYGFLQAVGVAMPPRLISAPDVTLNLRAVGAAFGIAALSTLVFALAPLLKLSATDPGPVLQANGARSFGGKALGRFRFGLATSQIALSMLLLVLAGLFTQSLANIARIDLGLQTESVLTFGVAPNLSGYTAEHSAQVFEQIEQRLREQPGVMSVTASMVPLLANATWSSTLNVEGYEAPASGATSTNMTYAGTDFLKTLGIALLAGREFTEADSLNRPNVAIVNQAFADKYHLGANPIGKRFSAVGTGSLDIEIVGLFKDSAYSVVKGPFVPVFVLPWRQSTQSGSQGMNFYVRTAQAPEALLAAIPKIVAQVDPNLPAMSIETLATQVRKNVQTDWLLTAVSGALAGVATLLAAIGLYGVLSYTVAQRTREIGVRLALGAEPREVRAMVLKQVSWMALIGVPLGLVGALGIGRLAAALLYDLAPTDPVAFSAAAVLLSAVVLGASYLPARRASRVEPVVALRSE
jgi:predicted permease